VLIVAIVAVGLLKPWGNGPVAATPASDRPTTLAAVAPPEPVPTPSLDPHSNINGPCYYGLALRLFTTDTTNNGLVHTWYGLDPVAARILHQLRG